MAHSSKSKSTAKPIPNGRLLRLAPEVLLPKAGSGDGRGSGGTVGFAHPAQPNVPADSAPPPLPSAHRRGHNVHRSQTCQTRIRFEGRFGRTAPCDLAIPAGGAAAQIVVAAKAFDSTGSKLTDAVREIEEMAAVRKGSQSVMAAIDGVGWLSQTDWISTRRALSRQGPRHLMIPVSG